MHLLMLNHMWLDISFPYLSMKICYQLPCCQTQLYHRQIMLLWSLTWLLLHLLWEILHPMFAQYCWPCTCYRTSQCLIYYPASLHLCVFSQLHVDCNAKTVMISCLTRCKCFFGRQVVCCCWWCLPDIIIHDGFYLWGHVLILLCFLGCTDMPIRCLSFVSSRTIC